MRAAEFWSSTLPEIYAFLEGSRLAGEDARDLMISGAWYTEAFARHKQLPALSKVLPKRQQLKPRRVRWQTKEQLEAEWRAFFGRQRTA